MTTQTNPCCPPILSDSLREDDAVELAGLLKVLADPARLRLLNLIAQEGEMCSCDLTEPLGLTQPTVSHHLRLLREAGFVVREQRGKWAFFSVVADRLDELRAVLAPAALAD